MLVFVVSDARGAVATLATVDAVVLWCLGRQGITIETLVLVEA